MTIAYFDCRFGVAGDMVLGALVDLGLPLSHLKKQLRLVDIGEYEMSARKVRDPHRGINLKVATRETCDHSHYADVRKLVEKSRLNKETKEFALKIFEKLARAEAAVHDVKLQDVHFHEVGSVDSLVDVIGSSVGFDYFSFDSVFSSPFPYARGRVKCQHGILPVPAPAVAEIMKSAKVEPSRFREEIVTPTGAAIVAAMSESFGECPIQQIKGIGYGFGDKKIPGSTNALRIVSGEGFQSVVIETNIDDMNPEILPVVVEGLLAKGAVEAFVQPVQMKKGRVGFVLSAISPWELKNSLIDYILKETTTFGVRYYPVERKMLERKLVEKKVKRGKITFKLGLDDKGRVVKAKPEFEDVKKLAKKSGRPIAEIYYKLERKRPGRG